jgi:TonB family protein
MAENINRVLKIGLIQDGVLVEDTVLGKQQGLSVGTDPKNTLLINDPSLPRRHQLIDWSAKGYRLQFLPEMKGRLLIDEHFVDFAKLIATGQAAKSGAGYEVLLKPDYKGKIAVGESTILFQLVPPPAPPAPVVLPKEIRGGFFRNIDIMFVAILIFSALAHTGAALYLQTMNPGEEEIIQVAAEQLVAKFDKEDIIVPEEKKKDDEAAGAEKKKGGGAKGGGTEVKVESKGVLSLLTRASGNGAMADLLKGGIGDNLKDAMNGIGGVRIGKEGDTGGGTRGDGTGGPGSGSGTGIGDIGSIGSGGSADTGNRSAHMVKAKLATGGGGVTGKIDAEKVRGYIRSQLGGVRHCYEMQLNVDRNLQGKVKVLFSIDSSGSVASCSVTENSMGNTLVGDCVCRRVEHWRFPPPDEGTVTVSYTFIFTPAAD